jgi:type III secretion protein C
MMNSIYFLKRWLTAALAVLMLLAPVAGQAAAPANWKDTGFSVDAQGLTLHDVLRDFGRVYGVTLSVEVDDTVRLKGRFKADSGTDFLDRLGQAYHFNWFVSNGTLFIVSRTDNTSMRLQIGEDAVQDAKAALVGLGLFDPRFGWGELPDEGIVIVSGPRRYVELARDVLLPDEKKLALKERQVMMFRLKYASATDRTITTRGKTETIPGVKTILSGLLFGANGPEKSVDDKREVDAGSNKRSHTPKIDKGDSREVPLPLFGGAPKTGSSVENAGQGKDNERAWKSKDSSDDVKPRIEANPALNALLIYDKLSKRPVYQALIDQLDVEPQQVEIEAIIVDIDRSKLLDLGVEWGFNKGNTTTTINGTRADSAGAALPIPGATLMISNVAHFYARLKALEGTGDAQVLATPTVLTLDNVAAVLDLSQTAYVPLTGERVADLADVTAGTMLRVIPRIIQDGADTQVRMDVDIEDGALDTSGTNVNATRSTISTQAIVELQQTLMIGGYHSDSISKDRQKTPVLGDIPLFGNLFKSTTNSSRSRERLFLITPRLVGGAAARAAAAEQRKVAARQTAEIHNTLRREAPAVNAGQKSFGDQTAQIKGANDLSIIDWNDPHQKAGEAKSLSNLQAAPAPQPASGAAPVSAISQASPTPAELTAKRQAAPIVELLPARPVASPVARAEPALASAAATKPMSTEATMGTVVMPPRPVKYKCARPKGARLLPA